MDVADRALDPLGLPMRPLDAAQAGRAGVAQHVGGALHAAFPDRFAVSENLRRIVELGQAVVCTSEPGVVDPEVAGCSRSATRR